MIRRHPHVFAAGGAKTPEAGQRMRWEEIKRRERAGKPAATTVARRRAACPARADARRETAKPRRRGRLRLAERGHVTDKIAEEARELAEAPPQESRPRSPRNSAICCSRWPTSRGISSSTRKTRLRAANAKFVRRFKSIEARLSPRPDAGRRHPWRRWRRFGRRRRSPRVKGASARAIGIRNHGVAGDRPARADTVHRDARGRVAIGARWRPLSPA